MSLLDGVNETATTPGRVTHLILNRPFPGNIEPIFSLSREGTEIARAGLTAHNSENVMRYGAGAIGLKAVQHVPGALAETAAGAAAIIPKSDFDFPAGLDMRERPLFRQQTELTGVTYDASVSATGDNFLVKTVAAGDSWNQSHTAHQTAHGSIPITPAHVPIDRIGVGKVTYQADAGYCWRFSVSATQKNSPQMLGSFYFGGATGSGNVGVYGLAIDGTGAAILFEQVPGATILDPPTFSPVFNFRYSAPNRISGTVHQIIIKPYICPSGLWLGYIDFFVSDSGLTQSHTLVQNYFAEPMLTQIQTYTVNRKIGTNAPYPNTTGAGNVWHDQPRDKRHYNQFSTLVYLASGAFGDLAFTVPFIRPTNQNLTLSWVGTVPPNCTLTGRLYSTVTQAELPTTVLRGDRYVTYAAVANQPHYYAVFEYTSDGKDTPLLWSYKVQKDGWQDTPVSNEVEAKFVFDVSVSGAESDPSHETMSCRVEDVTNSLSILTSRSRIPAILELAYDPGDLSKRSRLFDGLFMRSPAHRKGTAGNEGAAGKGSVRQYPDKKWRSYLPQGMGQWMRLNEKRTHARFVFGTNAPDNPNVTGWNPWKITDIARTLINHAGYFTEDIDIPDNDMRIFLGPNGDESMLCLAPLQQIGPFVVKLLKDYLGWFLIRDGNAGTSGRGMWRAVAPKLPPYNNLATFYTGDPGMKPVPYAVNAAGAYGNANAGYWSETGAVSTFIRKGSDNATSLAPEANAILVIGGGVQLPDGAGHYILHNWAVNPKGLDFFSGVTPDPTDPDWIGELVPVIYYDMSLSTQEAVDFYTRRLYDIVTHGVRIYTFDAPLILVTDGNDSSQTRPRPPRYYDPVQVVDDGVTSQWLVRNVNPHYTKDSHQWATYELESPREPFV